MKTKSLTILGINPGTRYFALVVLRDGNLMDWRIKAFNGKWSEEKLRKARAIISNFIKIYQPNILAFKSLHPSRNSNNLKKLERKIFEIGKENQVKFRQYSIQEIESFLSPGRRINKRTLSEMIVSQYPILQPELHLEQRNKSSYYVRMFVAVAVATLAQVQISR